MGRCSLESYFVWHKSPQCWMTQCDHLNQTLASRTVTALFKLVHRHIRWNCHQRGLANVCVGEHSLHLLDIQIISAAARKRRNDFLLVWKRPGRRYPRQTRGIKLELSSLTRLPPIFILQKKLNSLKLETLLQLKKLYKLEFKALC